MGVFPPGKKDAQLTAIVLQNLLKAHVEVYGRLKKLPGGEQAQIGLVKNIVQFDPSRRWHALDWLLAHKLNALFTESILNFFKTGDFDFSMPGLASLHYRDARAQRSLDFIGLNYYSHLHVKFNWSTKEFFKFTFPDDAVMTDMAYTIYPEGFYRALQAVQQLRVPIYVTENGIADAKDDHRPLFISRYLYALHRAMQDGAEVRGYFYWSLMDNFEWAEGYDMKFGLYEVDFNTQERRLREGAHAFVKAVKGAKDEE
jgi:beta-glucosidase